MAPDGICGGTLCFPDSRGQVAWSWVHALTSILWLTCRAQGSALSDTARSVVTVVCWGTGNSFFVITYKSRNAPTLCLKLEAATEHMYFFPILARISRSEPNRYAFSTRSGWSCAHVTTVLVLTMFGPSAWLKLFDADFTWNRKKSDKNEQVLCSQSL